MFDLQSIASFYRGAVAIYYLPMYSSILFVPHLTALYGSELPFFQSFGRFQISSPGFLAEMFDGTMKCYPFLALFGLFLAFGIFIGPLYFIQKSNCKEQFTLWEFLSRSEGALQGLNKIHHRGIMQSFFYFSAMAFLSAIAFGVVLSQMLQEKGLSWELDSFSLEPERMFLVFLSGNVIYGLLMLLLGINAKFIASAKRSS